MKPERKKDLAMKAEETVEISDLVEKVIVNLPTDMVDGLEDLAERERKTFTQVLKEAVALKLFVSDVIDKNGKLLVEHSDKTIERVNFETGT